MVYAYKLPVDNRPAWVATAMTKAPEDQALARSSTRASIQRRVAIIDTSAKDDSSRTVADASRSRRHDGDGDVRHRRRVSTLSLRSSPPRRARRSSSRTIIFRAGPRRPTESPRRRADELQPDRRRAPGRRAIGAAALRRCRVSEGEACHLVVLGARARRYWELGSSSIGADRPVAPRDAAVAAIAASNHSESDFMMLSSVSIPPLAVAVDPLRAVRRRARRVPPAVARIPDHRRSEHDVPATITASRPTPPARRGAGGRSAALAAHVIVKNAAGEPLDTTLVTFAVTTGSGRSAMRPRVPNATGQASTTWTLGGTVGLQTATATVGALTPVTFTAVATAVRPQRRSTKVAGDAQTAAGDHERRDRARR